VELLGIVSPDSATVYVRNEPGCFVSLSSLRPLFKIFNTDLDKAVQLEIAENLDDLR